jgi:hypothetical protein
MFTILDSRLAEDLTSFLSFVAIQKAQVSIRIATSPTPNSSLNIANQDEH